MSVQPLDSLSAAVATLQQVFDAQKPGATLTEAEIAKTAAARGFASSTRAGASVHTLRNDAQMIVWEHERVCQALSNLYPDLVA